MEYIQRIKRSNVTNDLTLYVIEKTTSLLGTIKFKKGSDGYWLWHIAPNYYGIEHLLAQHADKLGKKEITGIEVVKKPDDPGPDVILSIGDKE